MSGDIVARLRLWVLCYTAGVDIGKDLEDAADEIERLRGIVDHYEVVRQDYCSKWFRWISNSDGAELTRWLRSYATEIGPPDFDGDDVKQIHAAIDKRILEAADEIERLRAGGCARGQTTTQFCAEAEQLRAERDEARQRVCTMSLQLGQVYRRVGGQTVRVKTAEGVADMMGWQCFNENAARCGDGGAGAHTAGPTETFIPEAL